MCVAVIGGMDRLRRYYKKEAERAGIHLKMFNKRDAGIPSRIKHTDAVIIFTNKVSHAVKKEATNTAKSKKIPVLLYLSRRMHTAGLSELFKKRKWRKQKCAKS